MIRHAISMIAGLFVAAACSSAAPAGEAADLASDAEASAAAGNHGEALEMMREAYLSMWQAAPLSIAKMIFVSGEPAGYGLYDARPGNVFAPGDPLVIYAEPVGYGWRRAGGRFHSDITVDFEIRTADREILGGRKEFGRFSFDSLVRATEYMAYMSINLAGAPAGEYVLEVTFHDQVDGDSRSVDLPFEIR